MVKYVAAVSCHCQKNVFVVEYIDNLKYFCKNFDSFVLVYKTAHAWYASNLSNHISTYFLSVCFVNKLFLWHDFSAKVILMYTNVEYPDVSNTVGNDASTQTKNFEIFFFYCI